MISGAAPAHAVFFGAYEFTKHRLGGDMAGHHPIQVALAGACATIAMDGILTPMDAVKQRMQLGTTGRYSGVLDVLRKVRRREEGGLRSLYAGYGTTLVMNVPYHAFFFTSYETLKILATQYVKRSNNNNNNNNVDNNNNNVAMDNVDKNVTKNNSKSSNLNGSSNNSEDEGDDEEEDASSVLIHLSCGAGAGITASALTNPLDVAKTRLQTQHETGKRYSGMVDALKTIWREEGMRGMMMGVKPRVMLHSTSAAIVWAVYEYMKAMLSDAKPSTKYTHIDP